MGDQGDATCATLVLFRQKRAADQRTGAERFEEALGHLGAEEHFTMAIAQLEDVARADGDVLDHDTAFALNAGLTVIDDAIDESRAALELEPESELAQESLFVALRRKVALLQDTVTLINEMRTGDQGGTARFLPESNR